MDARLFFAWLHRLRGLETKSAAERERGGVSSSETERSSVRGVDCERKVDEVGLRKE